jgi:hypothetical protein
MSDEEERTPELLVAFSIKGRNFDLAECSARIGREATRTWIQRHEHMVQRRDIANTVWTIASAWTGGDSVDEAVGVLLDEIWPYRAAITGYVADRDLSANLECSVRIWSEAPLYSLSVETMRRLVALGAEFSLDLYDYREDAD